MNQPPAFQFYADDFIAGVADMTQNEVGAYIMLLAHGWNTRGLSNDDPERLKILAKGDVSAHVLGKFKLKNGRLFNNRQEKERKKQAEYRAKQAINGAKGGRPNTKPKPNPSLSFGLTQTEPKKSSPTPTPTPTPSPIEEGSAPSQFSETPSWEEFWEYCQSVHCGIAAEWFAKDKYWAACQDNWKGKSDWRAYALRVRGWWDNDGRPMTPPSRNGQASKKPIHHLRDMTYDARTPEQIAEQEARGLR